MSLSSARINMGADSYSRSLKQQALKKKTWFFQKSCLKLSH
uniref:Uncharacterized protein n=1 Tax=Arundo donax TaxID=35708 RepID=A0A0A9DIV5_ARUDO